MKKYFVFIALMFAVPTVACAGSASCSGTTVISAFGVNVNLTSQCILSVEKSFVEATVFHVPSSATIGDEFTIEVNTPYNIDSCDFYIDEETQERIDYCWPSTVSLLTPSGVSIDGSSIVELVGFYSPLNPYRQRVKIVYAGSGLWNATYYESN